MNEKERKAVKRAFGHFIIDRQYYLAGDISASNVSGVMAKLLEPVRQAWRVVGITEAAFAAFKKAKFSKPKIKLTRAHLVDRKATIEHLLKNENLTQNQFRNGVLGKKDHCILALSYENRSIAKNKTIIKFKNLGDDPLFQRSGYSWRYGEAEMEFLRQLH
jgi:hypothetical protein